MVTFVINYNSDTLSLPKSATTLYMSANAETAESNFSSGLCSRRHTARAEAHFPHGEFSHTLPKHSHRGETYSFTGVERTVPGGWNTQFHGDGTHSSTGMKHTVPWGWNTQFHRGGTRSSTGMKHIASPRGNWFSATGLFCATALVCRLFPIIADC